MKRHILKFFIILFFFSCSDDEFREVGQTENRAETDLRIQYKRGDQVSDFALNYIKKRTNNTFAVRSAKGSVILSTSSSFAKNSELGTVDTSKEIVVVNETNTKHTFKIINPNESLNTITNLIVVEKGESSYEYFLRYTFTGELPINEFGTVDFSKFNGTIETFNTSGNLIGSMTIENGTITDDQGQLSPCPDDTQNPSDDTNDGSSSGGSDSSAGIPDGNDEQSSNGGNGDPDTSAQFTDSDGDCGLTWSYEQCGCGGGADGHPPSGPGCCQGSPLVIRDCNGTVIAQRNSGNATTIFKRNATDPCGDGDVGVILTDDVLCEMDDTSFNAYYSSKSPFNVDLSDIRRVCDTITLPDPTNEKFMCVYNKLIKSNTFKNLFNDVFGENNENMNVKFELVDNLTHNGGTVNGLATRHNYTLDSNGNITSIDISIKINNSMLTGANARPPMEVAKTIVHECIHAYLYVKILDCSQGTSLTTINNALFEDLINQFFDNNSSCSQPTDQHDFMINYMLPTMTQVLSEIRDDIIPENQRQYIENNDYYNTSQSLNGPLTQSTPFNWPDFYKYTSLMGLQNTAYYNSNIAGNPVQLFLMQRYNVTLRSLSKNCNE